MAFSNAQTISLLNAYVVEKFLFSRQIRFHFLTQHTVFGPYEKIRVVSNSDETRNENLESILSQIYCVG